jgi:hypothetical protein
MKDGKSSFVWPFEWDIARKTLLDRVAGDYIMCFSHKHDPSVLMLGDMLRETFDAASQVLADCSAPEGLQSHVEEQKKLSQAYLATALGFESRRGEEVHGRSLNTSWSDPMEPTLEAYIAGRLQRLTANATERPQAVYMVTGIKIAQDIEFSYHTSMNILTHFASPSWGADSSYRFQHQVLLVYQLNVFRLDRRRGKFVKDGTYRVEEDW